MFSIFTWKVNYTNVFIFILLGLTPIIYIENLYDKTTLPRFALITLLILPAFLLLIINKLKSPFFNWHSNILFLLLFVLLSAISIIWGGSYGYYEEQLIKLLIFSLVFLIGTQSTNIKLLQLLFYISIFSATIVSLIGILQKFYFNPFNFFQLGSTASTFINRNFAANYIDLIIPINFILLISSHSKQKVWLLTISLSLLLSYILIIHSRGSWLALIVFFVFVLISANQLNYFNKKLTSFSKKYVRQLIILFIVPMIIFLLPGNSNSLQNESKRYIEKSSPYSQTSITVRKNAYLTALDMIHDQPVLGVGLGNFHITFRSYARAENSEHKVFSDLVYLHNDLLQIFVETGLIGGSILFLIIGNTLYFTVRLLKSTAETPDATKDQTTTKLLALGLLLALTSSITHALVSFPLHQATSGFIFYLWFGLLTGLLSHQVKITNTTARLYKVIFIISLFFMIFSLSHYANQLKSNYYINKAMLAFNDKNCTSAINHVDKSMSYYAKDYYPQSWAISIYGSCKSVDEDKKLRLIEKILSNNPLHPWALKMAALLYYKQGNYSYSEQSLRLLTSLYPSLPATYIELGNVLYKQEQYSEAYNQYLKAITLSPQHPLALKMLKRAHSKIK